MHEDDPCSLGWCTLHSSKGFLYATAYSFAEVQLTLHIADANPRLDTCVEKEREAHIHETHCNHNADLGVRSSVREYVHVRSTRPSLRPSGDSPHSPHEAPE